MGVRLYGDNPSVQQSLSQTAPGELLVEGVSCVWKVRQTLVAISVSSSSVCSSTVCSSVVCLCILCVHFLLAPPILLGA